MSIDTGPLKQVGDACGLSGGGARGGSRRPQALTVNVNEFCRASARELIKFNLFCFAPAKPRRAIVSPFNLAGNPMLSRLFCFITAAAIFGLAWSTFVEASRPGLPGATRAGRGRSFHSLRLGSTSAIATAKVHPRQAQAHGRALDQAELEGSQRDQQQGEQRDRADQQPRPLGNDARSLGLSGRRQGRLQDLCTVQAQAAHRPRLPPPAHHC